MSFIHSRFTHPAATVQPAPGIHTPTRNKNDYDGIRLWLSKVLSTPR